MRSRTVQSRFPKAESIPWWRCLPNMAILKRGLQLFTQAKSACFLAIALERGRDHRSRADAGHQNEDTIPIGRKFALAKSRYRAGVSALASPQGGWGLK